MSHYLDPIWQQIKDEVIRARRLHPRGFPANPERAAVLLVEEVGEVAAAIQRGRWTQMEKELVEVAATAVQWLAAIDGISVERVAATGGLERKREHEPKKRDS